ncbi:50S ribosomal protein L13 [Blochmannia endosymbiont of Camponotus (Colobopsis) obliquus]|uniref:50S ribosomal protein L13 n=1 Tax=Blochmannia endosymbiont of Camponotus (Colobopsis) obliquus TaxID=1505597 RepID=UPI00061A745F|nr:50S ribosomal protein L13 [Blochmannia endosymbiont of Camponotus (Colobopsis) obliquus]AKC60232.1 50S ribosomal protein L13 [Blochmannia endosymbiont of Camponotus (Colobopsis) obliquus]
MRTFVANSQSVEHVWYVIDATHHVLGRFASRIACVLRGKHKEEYTPHVDTGDYVVVLNAKNIVVTGNKYKKKLYYRHTGYVGGIKEITFEKMMLSNPERIIEIAVKGMLPKGPLGRMMYRKLKVYPEAEGKHLHMSQKLRILKF